jgi:hypothetical protein
VLNLRFSQRWLWRILSLLFLLFLSPIHTTAVPSSGFCQNDFWPRVPTSAQAALFMAPSSWSSLVSDWFTLHLGVSQWKMTDWLASSFPLYLLLVCPPAACSACCLLHAGFSLGLLFDPEDGGDMFVRNVDWHSLNYTALYPTRLNNLKLNLPDILQFSVPIWNLTEILSVVSKMKQEDGRMDWQTWLANYAFTYEIHAKKIWKLLFHACRDNCLNEGVVGFNNQCL